MDLIEFLQQLPKKFPEEFTEADTRANVIDPILRYLGWAAQEIKREPYAGWSDSRGFIDYLLSIKGRPLLVIEAKKVGRSFKIPSALIKQQQVKYKKLIAPGNPDLLEALDQCLRYSQHTGAVYACATNGNDWLIFKPMHPSRPLQDAKVIIFTGAEEILKRLDQFENLLSPSAIEQGGAEIELLGRDIQVPFFAKRLNDAYPYYRQLTMEEEDYSNILDQMLQHYVMELTTPLDFDECYLPVKGNKMPANQIESLVSNQVRALSQNPKQGSLEFSTSLIQHKSLPSIISGRIVILHGSVGAGKTSFLRHCKQMLEKSGKLDRAVWAPIDLLPFTDRAFAIENVKAMLNLICEKVQSAVSTATESMDGKYDPDSWDHLRDIYNSEVRKFQKAKFPNSNDSDEKFLTEARNFVWNLKQQDPQEHLIRTIKWLTVNCSLPVILAMDNSDQLGLDFQEFLYKLCESLQQSTSSVVILVLRTEAINSHGIREHSIASVRDQFLIEKAPLAQVLLKRFARIVGHLERPEFATQSKVARDRMMVLMETLNYEAKLGSDMFQIVEAAGNGSLRDSLRAVAAIFRSSPRAMDLLVVEQHKNQNARLSTKQTLRALGKDDSGNKNYSKLIPNLFEVDSQLTIPYSLGLRMMQQVKAKTEHGEYVAGNALNDFSITGIDRSIVQRVLSQLLGIRVLSVPHMLPEFREQDPIRITRLGEVILNIVLGEASYFEHLVFETYIYDKETFLNIKSAWNSQVEHRIRFESIGRQFRKLVIKDDDALRRRFDFSSLEPVVCSILPGLLGQESLRVS